MQNTPPLKRAAQYVRMSTDQQQYSTTNQKAAIALWAEVHDIEIVATYEDAGRSGLTLAGRPALRKLIADALAGPKLFEAILVYDISRWGRFQDADESAHLEYLCRSAGVTVHYCAEQFSNDGSTMANLYKVLKRTLAAEYSRELSEKTKIGKARLAGYGFHQGSVPGFGFRRRLLDQHGTDKGLLAPGERKSLTTDRVILTLGPPKELATVRWIYAAYTKRGLSMADICRNLNARGIGNAGRKWTKKSVYTLLTSPKYAGDCVWGMTSCTLGRKTSQDREKWSTLINAIKPIVSRELFALAQQKRQSWSRRWTDEQLLIELKKVYQQEGRISCRLLNVHGLQHKVFRNHFGTLANACRMTGIEMQRSARDGDWWKAHRKTRTDICNLLVTQVENAGGVVDWPGTRGRATVNGEVHFQVYAATPTTFPRSGHKAWQLRLERWDVDLTVFALLDDALNPLSCFLLPLREARDSFKFRETNEIYLECFRAETLSQISLIGRRVPIDLAEVQRDVVVDANPFELAAVPERLLRAARRFPTRADGERLRNSFQDVISYLKRKRGFIEKAAFTRSAILRLSFELRGILHRPGAIGCLQTLAITTVPAAIFERCEDLERNALAMDSHEDFGHRTKQGLCQLTVEKLAGQKVTRSTAACLAMMRDQCQVAAASEMIAEQRCSYEMARLLLALAPAEEIVVPRERRLPTISAATMKLLRADAEQVRPLYAHALRQYPGEALALVSLIGFGRRLAEDSKLAGFRRTVGRHSVRRLRDILNEIRDWRETKSGAPFARGWVT